MVFVFIFKKTEVYYRKLIPVLKLRFIYYLRKSFIKSHKDIKIANMEKTIVNKGNFQCKNSSSFKPPKKPSKIVTTN